MNQQQIRNKNRIRKEMEVCQRASMGAMKIGVFLAWEVREGMSECERVRAKMQKKIIEYESAIKNKQKSY